MSFTGDFLDKRIGVIREVEGNRALIDLEESVEGSRLFWEFYSGGSVRTLTVCEIRVLTGDRDGENSLYFHIPGSLLLL